MFGLIVLLIASMMYVNGSMTMEKFSQRKFASIILAQEARSTSLGLTTNVRAFANTGDPVYEKAYWDLEKIRRGDLPRPDDAAIEPGKKVPLEYLLSHSGFTEDEYKVLYKSVELSRTLMAPEIKAINAVKGIFLDERGLYTKKGEPDLKLAQRLLFGREYDEASSEIMAMSHRFVRMVTERIAKESLSIKESMATATVALGVSLLIITVITLAWAWMLLHHIIRPIKDCSDFAVSIVAGNPIASQEEGVENDKTNEIDVLQNSVHQMAWYLKDRIEHAELKTREALAAKAAAELVDVELWKMHAISEAKNIFFASMSHEIRTPINAITGLSDLLLRGELNDTQRAHMKDIRSSSEALHKIINDILDSAKMELGKLELVPIDYNFLELLDNVSSVAKVLAKEKGLIFACEKDDALPLCLYGDGDRVRQIMLNLLSNAVKYTQEGKVSFKVYMEGEEVIFEVSDTGVGIKDEVLPHLFNAFAQADRKKNKGIVGTGLGLYITRVLVEMMNGDISVKTVYGEGSIFTVSLPVQLGNKDVLNAIEEPPVECTWDAQVLVVDDNEINLNVASALLEYLGIEPQTAISGKESLEMVAENRYDLIFMDHMMPEMDGIETTAAIRAMGGWLTDVPVIALTANATSDARDMLLARGMNDFLSKPIDISMLRAMLDKWLPVEKKVISKP